MSLKDKYSQLTFSLQKTDTVLLIEVGQRDSAAIGVIDR